MKTYSLCIIDSEGNTVLDRDVTADQVIQMLLEEPRREEAPEDEKPADEKRSRVKRGATETKKKERNGKNYDRAAVIRDINAGQLKAREIAEKHGISTSMVFYLKTRGDKADEESDQLAAKNKALIANREKVARMIRSGASESEVYAAMHDHMTDAELREALELVTR